MNRVGVSCALGLMSLPSVLSAEPSRVTLDQDPSGSWQILRNGEPYEIRGAGGFTNLKLLRDLGGTTIRTWGTDQLGPNEFGQPLLDECADLGLTALVGLWVNHPRHGHDYGDQEMLQQQRDRIRDSVRKYRDHPALLMWGLGNEMEGDGKDPRVWRELEILARIVKEEDPNHPICTVLAGTGDDKIRALQPYFTSLDILGINIYSGAENVDNQLAAQGWDRPFLLAEFGPRGHWEVPVTDWGAPIEPTPAEKAAAYTKSYHGAMYEGRNLCLGAFAFIWGQKQETTATWYGMFLPTGEKTPIVDAMARAWTGANPPNQSPVISALQADFRERSASPNSIHRVTVDVSDADQDELNYEWQVVAESTDIKQGGDLESAPPQIADCIIEGDTHEAKIRLPTKPGNYRIFVYIRDRKGNGTSANFPFQVK
jgi:hypothetical protein